MKTTSKMLVIGLIASLFFFTANVCKAQSYMDFGPGSISWCWQQQQQFQAWQMQQMIQHQQLLQYYNNQRIAAEQQMMSAMQSMQSFAPYSGVYQYSGECNTYHTENVPCDYCNGGQVTRQYMSNGQVRTQKRTCGYCHGKGYTRKTVHD